MGLADTRSGVPRRRDPPGIDFGDREHHPWLAASPSRVSRAAVSVGQNFAGPTTKRGDHRRPLLFGSEPLFVGLFATLL